MDAMQPLRAANRLFVAAALPGPARAWLARVGGDLAARTGGRAVPEDHLHVTLDFLGRVPSSAAPALAEAVRAGLAGPSIRVAVGGLRARPRAARARLVAVLGRTPDGAALWPHVTVVRLGRPARLGPLEAPAGREQVFDVSRGALYDSHQSPEGPPRYRELVAVEFSPSP